MMQGIYRDWFKNDTIHCTRDLSRRHINRKYCFLKLAGRFFNYKQSHFPLPTVRSLSAPFSNVVPDHACEAAKYGIQKPLNLPRNIAFQVLGRCFSFFTLRDQPVAQQKHLLLVEESCYSK